MDDQRRIRYAVLDLNRPDVKEGSPDSDYWPKDPSDLTFPKEIATVGFAAAGNVRMPTVRKGGRAEPAAPALPEDVDPFLSTTARLTASAPFQVVSDGTHVVVFRQSIDRAHADAVFVLQSGDASGDPARTDYATPKSAVVDSTLLCDRFVLSGSALVPLTEVRYRRSRDRARPSSGMDTPGNSDMDGNPFVEPTHQLSFVKNLSGGAFAVLLLPTAVAGVSRWQVFARNGTTNRIDSFSVEQGADGLFHTQGTQLYTSPDPQYRSSVLERAPGKDPLGGKDLVPIIDTTGLAETALHFDGTGAVNLGSPAPLQLKGTPYTIEAWVKPSSPATPTTPPGPIGTVIAQGTPGQPTGYALSIDANGMLVHAQAGAQVTSTTAVGTGTFRHVAAVFDGTNTTLYVDGAAAGSGALAALQPETTLPVLIGAAGAASSLASQFQGNVDEVRVWNRAVSAADIARSRYHRLVGSETGLIGYWRFDEGAGTAVYDETDSGFTGTLAGGATWVTSTAGVGDGPGLSRETFALAGRTIVSGLAAELYYQQEQTPTGYEGKAQPLKKQARVLLACATAASPAQAGDRPYVAALDFAVGRDGRLAQLPMQVTLSALDRPAASSDSAALTAVQQQLAAVQARIDANNATIAAEGPNEQEIARLEPLRNPAE